MKRLLLIFSIVVFVFCGCYSEPTHNSPNSELERGNFEEAKILFGESSDDNSNAGYILAELGEAINKFASLSRPSNSIQKTREEWANFWYLIEDMSIRTDELIDKNVSISLNAFPLSIPEIFSIDIKGTWTNTEICLIGAIAHSMLIYENVYKSLLSNSPLTIQHNVNQLSLHIERLYNTYEENGGDGLFSFRDNLLHLPRLNDIFIGDRNIISFINTLDNMSIILPRETIEMLIPFVIAVNKRETAVWEDYNIDFSKLDNLNQLLNYLPIVIENNVVVGDPSLNGMLLFRGQPADREAYINLLNRFDISPYTPAQITSAFDWGISMMPRF